MKAIYPLQVLAPIEEPTIFLAGPTPRSQGVRSWRPRALDILSDHGVTVYVPESADGVWAVEYDDQVDWELTAISCATVVLFWVPRDLETLPGFTTNVEFGWVLGTKKRAVYGRPPEAPKTHYLDRLWAQVRFSEPHSTLHDTVMAALRELRKGG